MIPCFINFSLHKKLLLLSLNSYNLKEIFIKVRDFKLLSKYSIHNPITMQNVLYNRDGEKIPVDEVNFFYEKPFIFVDSLGKNKKAPVIIHFDYPCNLGFLDEIGIVFYSVPLTKKECWTKRQTSRYYIRNKSFPTDNDSKKLKSLPCGCMIEVDKANKRIRLWSDKIKVNEVKSEWIEY